MQGKANTSSGTIDFLTASSVNGVEKIEADLGWLTSAEVNTNTYQVSYQYQPLNGYVSGISSNLNNKFALMHPLFSTQWFIGEKGSQLIRFTETQTSDNAISAYRISNKLSECDCSAQRVKFEQRIASLSVKNNTQITLMALQGPSKPSNQMQGMDSWI